MNKMKSGNRQYSVWIQINNTLPWIELEETYRSRNEAIVAAKQKLNAIKIKIVDMSAPEQESEIFVPSIKIKASR